MGNGTSYSKIGLDQYINGNAEDIEQMIRRAVEKDKYEEYKRTRTYEISLEEHYGTTYVSVVDTDRHRHPYEREGFICEWRCKHFSEEHIQSCLEKVKSFIARHPLATFIYKRDTEERINRLLAK
jgi:hypothetical protein